MSLNLTIYKQSSSLKTGKWEEANRTVEELDPHYHLKLLRLLNGKISTLLKVKDHQKKHQNDNISWKKKGNG